MARRRTSGSRSRIGSELEGILADFCEAHHGANAHEITKRAIREFVSHDLENNPGIRKEFERLQKLRLREPNLKVVALDRDEGKN